MGGRLLLAACSVILLLERHLTLAHDNSPLVFEFMQTDAQRVKIYWDPMVSVQKVLELSNREVGFVADNATGELKEKLGSWRELVSDQDEDDGSKRYIFLKNAMCDEVDWQVKWTDGQGQMHGPSIYRMPPSPMPWTPEGKLRVDSIIYDPTHDAVFIKTSWNITDDKLNGQKKLSEYKPLLELQECRHFLKEAAPQPGMMENGDLVIPGAYGRAECSFYFRLSVTARNEELKCRDVFHTTDSQSVEIDASCGVLAGFDCPPQPKFPCDMDCNPLVAPVAEYRVDKQGFSQPAISIKWSSISTPDRPSVGTALRHAQIDRTHMDYPIKEFNATVEILEPNIFQFELEPYTKDPGASYGVQVCIFFEKACNDAELNWMTVGQSQILFNKFIDELPPPTPRKEIKGDSINTTKLTTKTSASPKKVDAEKHTEAIDNHISKSSEHRPKVDLRPPVSEPEPNAAHEVPTKKLTKPNPDNVQSEPQSVADNAAAITAKAFFGALCPMILALFTVVFL